MFKLNFDRLWYIIDSLAADMVVDQVRPILTDPLWAGKSKQRLSYQETTMTTPENNAQQPAAAPMFWAGKDKDGKTNGVTLWENTSETATEKSAQLTGYLFRDDVKTPVSVWVHDGANGKFASMSERNVKNDDGSYSNKQLGKGNAINTEGKDDAGEKKSLAADRVPYVLFNVGDKAFRANANASAIAVMDAMGFNESVVSNFEAKVQADALKKATPKP